VNSHRSTRAHVSLARLLSKFGHGSRSQAAAAISEGRVTVNAVVVRFPERWVDPRRDRVTLDGRVLRAQAPLYLVMHKPAGLVTTRSDERGRRTVYDLLPANSPWVFPVGRLDKETSGFLLFTNDTRFGETITNPESGVSKTYVARIDRPLEETHRKQMEEGMHTDRGDRFLPARVLPDPERTMCEVTLREGRNRQVRKMFEEFGYTIVALHRSRIGPLTFDGLAPGEVRPLRSSEVEALQMSEKERRA
jgi:23S rRNA pseudouridine2605 synthase